jgi:hypothetical protein
MANLNVNDKTWYKGDEVTITTEPYEMFGGMFQDAETETGEIVSIATVDQVEKNIAKARSDWKDQQSAFANLSPNN